MGPHGRAGATEADPLDPNPPAALRPVQEGYLYLEQAVTTIEWGEGLAFVTAASTAQGPRSAWLPMR